jgi:hypothetical protein
MKYYCERMKKALKSRNYFVINSTPYLYLSSQEYLVQLFLYLIQKIPIKKQYFKLKRNIKKKNITKKYRKRIPQK